MQVQITKNELYNYMIYEASSKEFVNYMNHKSISFKEQGAIFNKRVVSGPARQRGVEFGKFALELAGGFAMSSMISGPRFISQTSSVQYRGETFYRAMNQKAAESFIETGKLPLLMHL